MQKSVLWGNKIQYMIQQLLQKTNIDLQLYKGIIHNCHYQNKKKNCNFACATKLIIHRAKDGWFMHPALVLNMHLQKMRRLFFWFFSFLHNLSYTLMIMMESLCMVCFNDRHFVTAFHWHGVIVDRSLTSPLTAKTRWHAFLDTLQLSRDQTLKYN